MDSGSSMVPPSRHPKTNDNLNRLVVNRPSDCLR